MANNTDTQELKRQALTAISQGRAEISAELHHLRNQLAPSRVARRVVDRHASLVMVAAFAAGIIPALVFFRAKRPLERMHRPVNVPITKAPSRPFLSAVLMGALGVLGKTVAPALIRSALVPGILKHFARTSGLSADEAPPESRAH